MGIRLSRLTLWTRLRRWTRRTLLFVLTALAGALPSHAEAGWPDLAAPGRAVGGGERDAAVVVGIETYFAIPRIPGAEANAKAWYDYLTRTRGAHAASVALLRDEDASREDLLGAARKAAERVGPDGTLWFVFIGHGAPSGDGKDALLVGVDAQQKAESLQARSLKRGELLLVLGASRARKIAVVLDACFSGRGADGAALAPGLQPLLAVPVPGRLDPRMVVLTAARGDQFAGALPGAGRPAFSYLILGGLRGWAGTDRITAGGLWRYATEALGATLRGRNQTPDLIGDEATVLGRSPGERGPDLVALAKATAGTRAAAGDFRVTELPAVPRAQAPRALDAGSAGGLDFRNVDVAGLRAYDAAFKLDRSDAASPAQKAERWRQLAREAPDFAALAAERSTEWEHFAARQAAAVEALVRRVAARDADWGKLGELFTLDVVPGDTKERWATEFLHAYQTSPGLTPGMAGALARHVAAGPVRTALETLARFVAVEPGTFRMGSPGGELGRDSYETQHQVTLTRGFYLQATEVTQGQWRARMGNSPSYFASCGADCPVESVNWWEALAYANALSKAEGLPECYALSDCSGTAGMGMGCAGVTVNAPGGSPYLCAGYRLPTEAEWEYAYRAGTTTAFYNGGITQTGSSPVDPKLAAIGWYLGNSDVTYAGGFREDSRTIGPHPVGRKAANAWGLYDMAGNVWEWAWDWYAIYPGTVTDPLGGNGSFRVSRGGSWLFIAQYARAAYRFYDAPVSRDFNLGFRLARSVP